MHFNAGGMFQYSVLRPKVGNKRRMVAIMSPAPLKRARMHVDWRSGLQLLGTPYVMLDQQYGKGAYLSTSCARHVLECRYRELLAQPHSFATGAAIAELGIVVLVLD